MSIAEEELARIKREISIVRLVEARGVKLTGSGDNLLGLCPFHADKTPSLVVSPAKNVYHCMGKCQRGGSVIDWVMQANNVSFRLAVEMLRKEAPSLAAPRRVAGTRPKLDVLAEPDEPDAVVIARVVDYYHDTLKESPEALAYLEKRGLKHAELLEHFKLGYANRTLGYRLPVARVAAGASLRGQLQRIGLYRASGHEHLSGSLTIPVIDDAGEVREIYGRKIRDDLPATCARHLYLPARPDGRRGVFNWRALEAEKEIILCEALIDALTFWCAGFRNVTSAYGVEGFTEELRLAFKEHGTQKILIAYDRDAAGDRAAEKLASDLAAEGLEVFRILFPKGMDANEYALKVQPAARSLETAIRGATWIAGTRSVTVPEGLDDLPELVATEPDLATPPRPSPVKPAAASEEGMPPPPIQTPSLAAPVVAAPEPPRGALELEQRDQEIRCTIGERRWRIRGLAKATSYESLRLNLLVAHKEAFFVDTLELYSARHRGAYLKEASEELGLDERILKSDLGRIVLRLEDLVHAQIQSALHVEKKIEMSEDARTAALELLKDPSLLDRILRDFDQAGVVGEETNKLVGYLAAVSRKLDAPLAIVIQSSSAAGKSSLMDAILRFVPEEERVQYSAMTGQSLFYMGETDLAHKILAIAEEEGAQSASYALKLLQSEGELTIASTGKDPTSGKLVTHEYRVTGPVMIFLTTTAIEVDEELLNRCLVLTVDEGGQQTSAIHERQRQAQTLEGLLAKEDRAALVELHQNAQRLIEPLFVANPHAKTLRFSSQTTRARRDHMKYLTLIRAIALLHQHQRPIHEIAHKGRRIRYVEVNERDIAIADRIATEVLGHCLDELPPQTRRLLEEISRFVAGMATKQGLERDAVRFTRRDIREHTRLGNTQLRVHLARLEDLEYLLVPAGGAKRRVVYELAYDPNLAGVKGDMAGPSRPLGGEGVRHDISWNLFEAPTLGGSTKEALKRPATNGRSYPSLKKANGR